MLTDALKILVQDNFFFKKIYEKKVINFLTAFYIFEESYVKTF